MQYYFYPSPEDYAKNRGTLETVETDGAITMRDFIVDSPGRNANNLVSCEQNQNGEWVAVYNGETGEQYEEYTQIYSEFF